MPSVMDVKVRGIRNLRLKHGITLQEIAEAAGRSVQWVSSIEMGMVPVTSNSKRRMILALELVMFKRLSEAAQLQAAFRKSKNHSLFKEESEWIKS